MGVFDKLKNFFYEEEPAEESDDTEEETLARKVEVPKVKEKEHSRFDETQEIKFSTELPKFEEEEEVKVEPVAPKVEEKKEKVEEDRFSSFAGLFNDEDFEDQPEPQLYDEDKHISYNVEKEKKETYQPKREEPVYQPPKKTYKSTYSFDSNKRFIPSPIISPIYGILDTNYSKDDIKVQRVESYVAKSDIDTVRNKAFGYKEETTYTTNDEDDKPVDVKETVEVKVEVENHEEEPEENEVPREEQREETNSKPTVKKVTLEDADEYYNDLGLAYNEDYNDGQREEYQSRHNRYDSKNDSENDNLFNLIDKMYNKED